MSNKHRHTCRCARDHGEGYFATRTCQRDAAFLVCINYQLLKSPAPSFNKPEAALSTVINCARTQQKPIQCYTLCQLERDKRFVERRRTRTVDRGPIFPRKSRIVAKKTSMLLVRNTNPMLRESIVTCTARCIKKSSQLNRNVVYYSFRTNYISQSVYCRAQ